MVTFPMTLTDPYPRFQGHGIFEVEYRKNGAFLGTMLLKDSNRKPYTICRMVPMNLSDP